MECQKKPAVPGRKSSKTCLASDWVTRFPPSPGQGKLTRDPLAIEVSQRPLPIGYWKGSALSIVLDLVASVLSGGSSTQQIGESGGDEYGLSQIFIAFDATRIAGDHLCPGG